MTITCKRTISMGHRLPSYDGICSSPHGHNVKFEITVESKNDTFLDFKYVDGRLWNIIERFDHAMVLYAYDPLLKFIQEQGWRWYALNCEPTTEAIASKVMAELSHDPYFNVLKVVVHETDKYSAEALA